MSEIHVYHDQPSLMRALANRFVTLSEQAISARGHFSVVLSGGSTPRAAYQLLATPDYSEQIDWEHVYVFWGDERCVPPESPESNYRMARETLLAHVPVRISRVYRIRGEMEPQAAADAYEKTLRDYFEHVRSRTPRFDLILLGMGADGHTASLFPNSSVLNEERRWVVAHYVEAVGGWRVTLTLPVINAAAQVIFLVAGADKAPAVEAVLGASPDGSLPAARVQPVSGAVTWLLDAAAASRLKR